MAVPGVIGEVQNLETVLGQTYHWNAVILDLSNVKKPYFWESPSFWFRDPSGSRHEWRLRFCVKSGDICSIYVQYMTRVVCKKSIFAIKLSVHSVDGNDCRTDYHHDMTDGGVGQIIIQDFSMNDCFIQKLSRSYYFGEQLNVSCSIIALKSSPINDPKLDSLDRHGVSLKNEYELLFESGQFSDVTFIIEKKKLQLHKNILSSRSPVLAAMFNHDFKENISNEVNIEDQSYEIMKEFFRYIYSAKVNEIEKYAAELLFLSHKYDVEGLKSLCVQHIAESLQNENALECLNLAYQYGAETLKAECFEFILKNAKGIAELPSFDINKLSDDLRNELFKVIIKKS
ncbi:hypothetical protein QAD02_016595 [Eretmocerus hayati]|uniref:Uncharacterized protein n=1 Tax=Eretmocerus hayati TaxID=131215 RepID=A0ACC2PCJ9_9HYME|nr:hypothetical protein QAD02_016595 [Eretmocerus hayati]